jgi:protocatechuate 3,4-dioxygenase beta subunit
MIIQNEAMLTDAVCADMASTPNLRLREVMDALVRHFHAFVREVRLTEDEWETAVAFVTELGRFTNSTHNETILAADVIGVSTLVGMINNPAYGGETASALLGPFWRKNSPVLALGESIACAGTPGIPMFISGRVTERDGTPIAGAMVDVWQADPRGMYDNQVEGFEGMNLRGQFETDDQGRFYLRSVRPAGYPVPVHGPTGGLLKAQRRSPYRPAHVHFMVSSPGHKTLVTQVFADDAENLDSDVTFSVMQSLVATFQRHESTEGAPDGFTAPWCSLTYDMVLAPGERRFPTPPIE